jgi:hypothetical protein
MGSGAGCARLRIVGTGGNGRRERFHHAAETPVKRPESNSGRAGATKLARRADATGCFARYR